MTPTLRGPQVTGKPQVIGLGWLDDSMRPQGPTEEDRNYSKPASPPPATRYPHRPMGTTRTPLLHSINAEILP